MIPDATPMVGTLADAFEPWATYYGDRAWLSTTVVALHLAAMLLGGGLAVGSDRMLLRTPREDAVGVVRRIADMRDVHATVLLALGVMLVTGALMATADIATFVGSPVFWAKMAIVALLFVNGARMYRADRADRANANAATLRGAAVVSLAGWFTALVLGVVLTGG